MTCWISVVFTPIFILCLVTSLDCVDVKRQKEIYLPDYQIYHNVTSLTKFFKRLESHYPKFINISYDYVSKNGCTQLFTKVANFSMNKEERSKLIKVFLVYGEHAREFFPVESLLYLLRNLTEGTSCSQLNCFQTDPAFKFSSWVFSNFEFYVLPMTNPDGRIFLESSGNYCWRGTANGVDLNRNFDWNFGGRGSSTNPDDDEYHGKHVFSEPETRIFREVTGNVSMDAFLSFHSGVRHIYIPFADTLSKQKQRHPGNIDHMKQLAKKLSTSCPLRLFRYGLAFQLTGYCADGTSIDFMAGVRKIPFSLAIELWQHRHHQGRSCFDEFNPHSNSLEKELALIHPMYVELLSYLHKWKRGKIDKLDKSIDAQYKNYGKHKPLSWRQEAALSFNSSQKEYTGRFKGHLKILTVFTLLLIVLFALYRQMTGRKRTATLRLIRSGLSTIKNV